MWRSKKFIVAALLAAVLLVGGVSGVVFAQTGDDGQPKPLLARVAEILGIDQQRVEDAFVQAQSEIRNEALDNQLKSLVDEGRITQEQADQYEAWLQARPDMSQYREQLRNWQQGRPGIPQELEEWQQARPDVPLPGAGPFGRGGFGGGMGPLGGGHCWGW